ncbi:MAG: TIGR04086 family membrane protein [Oscillospiraceae bacterium]
MRKISSTFKSTRAYNTLTSVLLGGIQTIICLLAFSFIMSKIDVSGGIISAMSSVALCIGAYFSGFIAAKRHRKNGLLTGLLCGVVIFCIVFLISVIFFKSPISIGLFPKFVMIMICSGIGGIIGVNSKISYRK